MRTKIKENLPLTKHTLSLYSGDFAELQALHPEIGASVVVRRLVRNYIEKLDRDQLKLNFEEEVNV